MLLDEEGHAAVLIELAGTLAERVRLG